MVTIENWEEYAILRADGELDAAGLEALEALLAAHPGLAEEAQAYDLVRLVPEEAVVFAGKDGLLKPEPGVIALDRRWMWAAAAGLALLLGAAVLLKKEGAADGAMGGSVAGRVEVKSMPQRASPQPSPPAAARANEPVAAAQAQPVAAKNFPPKKPGLPAPPVALPQRPDGPEAAPDEALTPLLSTGSRLLAVAVEERRAAGVGAMPTAGAPIPPKEEPGNLLARLAPDRDRLQLVDDIRAAASERISALRSTREKLRGADVTVQVGKRELFTIHF